MAKRIRYLTDAELEIMRILWDSDKPIDSKQIQKGLVYRTWALSTLMSAIQRLEAKGYVTRDTSGSCIMYSVNMPESQYLIKVLSNMNDVHNIRNAKPGELMISLYEKNILSENDVADIRACADSIITGKR